MHSSRDKLPPELRDKDKELKHVQKKVNKIIKEIETMKRRLATTHSDESYKNMRNELRSKRETIAEMEAEIENIKLVQKGQVKAIKEFSSEDVSDDYVSRVKQMLVESKAECKALMEE